MTESKTPSDALASGIIRRYDVLGDCGLMTNELALAHTVQRLESAIAAALAAKERAENALLSINEIRNSIIGTQTMNWSEHVYPLVEALNGAGFEGMPYDEARGKFGTMLERTRKAESERDALAAKLAEAERLQLKQSTPPIVRYTLDISDGRMVKSPDGFWASADELAAAYTTIATLTSKLAEAESGSRVAAVEEINSMLESVMYPPPPYEVKVQEDYFSGATAYRNSLKAAIDAAISQERSDA